MRRFLDLKTSGKLYIGMALWLAMIAMLAAWSYWNIAFIGEKIKVNNDEHFTAALNMTDIKADMNGVRAALVTMMAEPDKSKLDSHNARVREITKKIEEKFGGLLGNGDFPADMQEDFRKINEVWTAFRDTRDSELIPAIYAGDMEKARGLGLGVQAERFKKFNELSDALIKKEREESAENVRESSAMVHYVRNGYMAVSAGLVLFNLIVNLLILRILVNPLADGVKLAREMAEGNMTNSIDEAKMERKDEVGFLMRSLGEMRAGLTALIKSVTSSSSSLAATSEELSASVAQIARGADEQSAGATHVAVALEEMVATIKDVARNASDVAEAAREANQAAIKGGRIVEKNIESMNGIAKAARESSEVITALESRSNEIGEIVRVIEDIADQTNLLALNAAIEAARAGDQGRGFAVVADEVRKLAEKTTKATKEIANMIVVIQGNTARALVSINDEVKAVGEGVKYASEGGEALKEIISNMEKVTLMVQQIAAASKQQTAAADQITGDMGTVANIAGETSQGVREIAAASQEGARLAMELQGMLLRFRLE